MNTISKNESTVMMLENLVQSVERFPENQVNLFELALDVTVTASGKTVAKRFEEAAMSLSVAAMPIFLAAGMGNGEEADLPSGAVKLPEKSLPPGPPVQRHIPVSPALDRSKH